MRQWRRRPRILISRDGDGGRLQTASETVTAIIRRHKDSILLLLMSLAIMVWRYPSFFVHPRFWAEEGVVVFGLMIKEGLGAVLRYNIGYFSFVPLVASALMSLTSIDRAPFVTLLVSLFFQVVVVAIVAFGNSPFWDSWRKKAIVCLAIVLLPQAEIWLTTIATQYWLCLGVFLIFLEDVSAAGTARRVWYRAILVLGCLNGIMSCFLAPVYIVRAFRDKIREHRIQALIMTGGSLLQGGLLLFSAIGNNAHLVSLRSGYAHLPPMHYVHKQFIWPFLGYPTDRAYNEFFVWLSRYVNLTYTVANVFSVTVMAFLLILFVVLLVDTRRSSLHLYVLASFFIVFILTCNFAVQMKLGGRYVFVPGVILFILLLDRAYGSRNVAMKAVAIVFVAGALFFNLRQYSKEDFMGTTGPDWREEVARWRLDCTYKPKVWPYGPGRIWEVDIPCPK